MARFILVHGAFHGAWCWERLVPLLEARGHVAIATDLPGMGGDLRPASIGTLAGYADHVEALVRAQPEKPILVGHSLGGATISEAGERAANALLGLVYLSAALLPPGVAIGQMPELGLATVLDPPMRMIADGAPEGCVVVHPEDVIPFMYHRTDAAGQARAMASVSPQPFEPMTVPLSITMTGWGSLPRAYIECSDDRILSIDSQRAAQLALPCDPVITLDADHSPFFSDPHALAVALDDIARVWHA